MVRTVLSDQQNSVHSLGIHQCICNPEEDLHKMVQEFFSIENFNVKHSSFIQELAADVQTCKLLEPTTNFNAERYSSRLLWKKDNIKLRNIRSFLASTDFCYQKFEQTSETSTGVGRRP